MNDSVLVGKARCPKCASRGLDKSGDNLAVYSDGHAFCFSCNYREKKYEGVLNNDHSMSAYSGVPKTPFVALDETENAPVGWRGVSADTMKHYHVTYDGINYHYPYGNSAYKVRSTKAKDFTWKGEARDSPGLFGMSSFVSGANYSVTITEGELDAMSAYQMLGSKYACVSVKSAQSAARDCGKEREWLNGFDKIILAFDNDRAGQEAAEKVAALFDINKVYFCKLSQHKDANAYLEAKQEKLFVQSWWNAKRFKPKGIISGYDEIEEILSRESAKATATYPFETLQSLTYGIRPGELVLLTAQEKVGKTEILRAIEYHLLKTTQHPVGIIHLEEGEKRVIQGLVSYELRQPVHLPDSGVSVTDQMAAFKKLVPNQDRLFIYGHFGSEDPSIILDRIRELVTVFGCKYIFLDHITMLVTGRESQEDERRDLDMISTKLAEMTRELDFTLFLVSHVNDEGKTRGSRNISKVADLILSLNRDIEAADPDERNRTYVVCKGNRFAGKTGPAGVLKFDPQTYILKETEPPMELDITRAA